ncbi:MAG: acylphosphatase [Chitinophagaceae bacterium]|nr:MAG: acylphosphatase [Chitinophagaceae bacterium]
MTRTVFLRITGKVQGVFYRATALTVARELGLRGWVRNNPDGSVESLASGDEAKVEAFITWCRRGPEEAIVDEVIVENTTTVVDDASFRILR